MSLVAYDSSDSEDNDEIDNEEETKSNEILNKNLNSQNDELNKNGLMNDLIEQDLKNERHFLPLPQPSNTDRSKLITNLTASKEKGKIKIFLPSYKGKEEVDQYDEDEDEDREFNKFKFSSSKGSGLKSLLPPPKNKIGKANSLIPDILKRKAETTISKSTNIKKMRPTTSKSIDEDDDYESVNFFTFEHDNKNKLDDDLLEMSQPIKPNKFETDLIERKLANSSIKLINNLSNDQSTDQLSTSSKSNLETDYQKQRKIKYEIEKKFGDQVDDEIQIQDVNIASHLGENFDYLKTLSEERDVQVKGPTPSSIAKRKHQITYLAYHAKQNELKLKNEWAQGKINRENSKSRYGF